MLLSLLFSISPTADVPILGSLGRPAQAWFLEQVTLRRPRLGQELHDTEGLKPYTVSTLLDDRGRPFRPGRWLQAGESCWLRMTTLGGPLSELVLGEVLRKLPSRLNLYKMEFRIDGWTLDRAQHPWAGEASFTGIAQAPAGRQNGSHSPRQVRLEFVSPTAFRSGGSDIPLPLPDKIFRSYYEKWNAFAPEAMRIHEAWPDFANNCLRVNELTAVNTERWSFAEGSHGVATGFTGTVGITLLPRHQCGAWQDAWDGAAVVLQTMAQFAFFCGTGHHTTIGLGQTRLLPRDDARKSERPEYHKENNSYR